MIGRPRSSSPWRVKPLNLFLLFLVLAPLVGIALYGVDLWVKAQQGPRDVVPEGPVGIVKVLSNTGISFKDRPDMNVMVLGIDYNWTDSTHLPYSAGARSDTMFVLHLMRDGSRLGMLTIPRDMYVDLPDGKGHDKINGAFSDGGVRFARKAVEQFLGIHVDHYVVLRIAGVKKLIDALGGIDINVEKNMNYDDNWGYLHVHLKKGFQHLNGEQTVGYARFRHDAESDFGRIRRQQQVVDTLIKKIKSPSNFTPDKLNKVAALFKEYVETDFNVPQMLDLALCYRSFDRKNFNTGYIPGTDGFVGDMSVLFPPDQKTIRQMVRKVLLASSDLQPADVAVEVLNGSDVRGAAGHLGDQLTAQGWSVVRVDDYSGPHPPSSMVVLHTADPKVASMVARLVPGLPVVHDQDYPLAAGQNTAANTQVTVILAADWTPSGVVSPAPSSPGALAPPPLGTESPAAPTATVTVSASPVTP